MLIAGGRAFPKAASAELYDPVAGTFTATGTMTVAGLQHTATLLSNGTVLMVGGVNPMSEAFPNEKRAELYDPNGGNSPQPAA